MTSKEVAVMIKYALIFLIAVLFLSAPSFAGEVYSWTDEHGVLRFSDAPTELDGGGDVDIDVEYENDQYNKDDDRGTESFDEEDSDKEYNMFLEQERLQSESDVAYREKLDHEAKIIELEEIAKEKASELNGLIDDYNFIQRSFPGNINRLSRKSIEIAAKQGELNRAREDLRDERNRYRAEAYKQEKKEKALKGEISDLEFELEQRKRDMEWEKDKLEREKREMEWEKDRLEQENRDLKGSGIYR